MMGHPIETAMSYASKVAAFFTTSCESPKDAPLALEQPEIKELDCTKPTCEGTWDDVHTACAFK